MAMDKISGSPQFRTGGLDKLLGSAANEKGEKAEANRLDPGASMPNVKPADTVEISDAAHRLVDLRQAVDTGRAAMAALPDTRADKVEEAKMRLRQGYYNSAEVIDKVAQELGSVFQKMDDI